MYYEKLMIGVSITRFNSSGFFQPFFSFALVKTCRESRNSTFQLLCIFLWKYEISAFAKSIDYEKLRNSIAPDKKLISAHGFSPFTHLIRRFFNSLHVWISFSWKNLLTGQKLPSFGSIFRGGNSWNFFEGSFETVDKRRKKSSKSSSYFWFPLLLLSIDRLGSRDWSRVPFSDVVGLKLRHTFLEMFRTKGEKTSVIAVPTGSCKMRTASQTFAATRSPHFWSCSRAVVTITVTWEMSYKRNKNFYSIKLVG